MEKLRAVLKLRTRSIGEYAKPANCGLPRSVLLFLILFLTGYTGQGQTVAIIPIDRDQQTRNFTEQLGEDLGSRLKILDGSLADSAYSSARPADPSNMTTSEGQKIGAVIGSQAFLLVRSTLQRRSAFGRPDYYEAYAVVYAISSRTGRLIYWKLQSFESTQPRSAASLLSASSSELAKEIASRLKQVLQKELSEPDPPQFEEAPETGTEAEKGIRLPIPYRRLKPEYTSTAALYGIAATVDVMIYLDQSGTIVQTETVRWAGFGLDDSVEKNIRSMTWRPAERNGKPIAMKFLVRYNFKKMG